MTTMAPQITSLTVVDSTVYSDADQRKHQSSASLAFVWGIHRDRWIPRTKGRLRGKCFHLMTSSCSALTGELWSVYCESFGESAITVVHCITRCPHRNMILNYAKYKHLAFFAWSPWYTELLDVCGWRYQSDFICRLRLCNHGHLSFIE